MTRLVVALLCTSCLLALPAVAVDSGRIDFALLSGTEPLEQGASSVRPADGEKLLVQFWASWCHSCSSLMWDMDELVRNNPGLGYVAISLDDDPQQARDYIRKHGLYARYSDRYFVDSSRALAESLDVETVPSIFLADADGNILVRKSGHLNSSDLRDFTVAIRGQD